MKVKNRQIIWRDSKKKEITAIITWILMITFFLIIILIIINKLSLQPLSFYLSILISIIIALLFIIYFFYLFSKRELIYLTKKGLRIGNVIHGNDGNLISKTQKPTFLAWDRIKKIKIVSKWIKTSKWSEKFDYLIIEGEKNKKFNCIIYDKDGFIKEMEKLRKINLIKNNKSLLKNKK